MCSERGSSSCMKYMKIQSNLNAGGVQGPTPSQRPASPATPEGDGVSIDSSAALDSTLKSLPESRPEAVERAKALVADPAYPSPEIMQKISRHLAAYLASDE